MIVKICGIRTVEDAHAAIEAGANMLGFNFYPQSVRFVSLETCRQIQASIQSRKGKVLTVGIFVNYSVREVQSIIEACHLDLAQLSGDEPPDTLTELGQRAFKAIRPRSGQEARSNITALSVRNAAPAFLLDSYQPGKYGGTGETGSWELAADLAKDHRFLLAGGLSPENIGAAVRQVQPWGVDVASGVEQKPGVQDPERIREFVYHARREQILDEDFS